MSDIKELLDHASRSAAAPPSPEVVDADVQRGRSALIRRRRRRAVASSIASTMAALAIVGTAIVVDGSNQSNDTPAVQPDRVTTPSAGDDAKGDGVEGEDAKNEGVKLVAYKGKQPPGFIVSKVPEGWYIQEPLHPAFSLTIAEKGDNSHPDAFAGKIAVMLQSSSFPNKLPPWGEPVKVNGRDGKVDESGGAPGLSLFYIEEHGRIVEIQCPGKLGWSKEQLIEFAEGVTVTEHAEAGIG